MINIVKNFDRIGLMVLMAAFFITVGFKATEKMENATAWYEVEIIDLDADITDPENQEIVGEYPNGAPATECSLPSGKICAIQLTFDEDNVDMPATVKQAEDSPEVSIKARVHQLN